MHADTDAILEIAKQLADAVARTFGSDCEVAVHDLRQPRHSLVHIANGHVTGREIGSPIRDLIFRVLPGLRKGENALHNYLTVLDDGRQLKSSSVLLRDSGGEPVVAFCINLDVTNLEAAGAALARLTSIQQLTLEEQMGRGSDLNGVREVRESDVNEVLETLIENVVNEFSKPADSLNKEERIQAVRFLNDKGAFLIKGSVGMVATKLAVSEPTIYRYLDTIRGRLKGGRANDDGARRSDAD